MPTPQEGDRRRAAGLIGLTARESGSAAFLRSWTAWGASLMGMLQAEQPVQLRAAVWAALSHTVARRACNVSHSVRRQDSCRNRCIATWSCHALHVTRQQDNLGALLILNGWNMW